MKKFTSVLLMIGTMITLTFQVPNAVQAEEILWNGCQTFKVKSFIGLGTFKAGSVDICNPVMNSNGSVSIDVVSNTRCSHTGQEWSMTDDEGYTGKTRIQIPEKGTKQRIEIRPSGIVGHPTDLFPGDDPNDKTLLYLDENCY